MNSEILSPSPRGNRDALQLCDNEIYLPEVAELSPDSEEFHALLERCLPENTASEVAAHFDPARKMWSRIQIIAAALTIAAMLGLAWYFFPCTAPSVRKMGELQLQDPTPSISRTSEYADLHRNAQKLFEAKKFTDCARLIAPVVAKIFSERTDDRHDRILWLYFNAAQKGELPPDLRSNAKEQIARMIEASPDNPEWRNLDLALNDLPHLDCKKYLKEIRSGIYLAEKKVMKDLVSKELQRLKRVEQKIASFRHSSESTRPENWQNLQKYADLYQAKLLICRWMIEGGNGTDRFPDDNITSPGVSSREEALAVILKYTDNEEFLKLKIFLAQTILDQIGVLGKFYWNGDRNSSKDDLKKIVQDAKEKLKNVKD